MPKTQQDKPPPNMFHSQQGQKECRHQLPLLNNISRNHARHLRSQKFSTIKQTIYFLRTQNQDVMY
uniref:Uncharacterized protein n=1 Tax=Arundo donax TaxID=35708 RepID=A0A0A9A7G9_ARUDO